MSYGGALRSSRYLLHKFQPDSTWNCRNVGAPTRDFVHYTVTGVRPPGIPDPEVARGLLGERRRAHGVGISTARSRQTRADQVLPPSGELRRSRQAARR